MMALGLGAWLLGSGVGVWGFKGPGGFRFEGVGSAYRGKGG